MNAVDKKMLIGGAVLGLGLCYYTYAKGGKILDLDGYNSRTLASGFTVLTIGILIIGTLREAKA